MKRIYLHVCLMGGSVKTLHCTASGSKRTQTASCYPLSYAVHHPLLLLLLSMKLMLIASPPTVTLLLPFVFELWKQERRSRKKRRYGRKKRRIQNLHIDLLSYKLLTDYTLHKSHLTLQQKINILHFCTFCLKGTRIKENRGRVSITEQTRHKPEERPRYRHQLFHKHPLFFQSFVLMCLAKICPLL